MVGLKRLALGTSLCSVPLDPAIPRQESTLGRLDRDLDYLDFVHRNLDYRVHVGVLEN